MLPSPSLLEKRDLGRRAECWSAEEREVGEVIDMDVRHSGPLTSRIWNNHSYGDLPHSCQIEQHALNFTS